MSLRGKSGPFSLLIDNFTDKRDDKQIGALIQKFEEQRAATCHCVTDQHKQVLVSPKDLTLGCSKLTICAI